ncbi:hypothetical protein Taro_037706 [Colocasia esculenta]|uniref:Uncharacterized protein n=1 Tax=Colocasia esculenta TaxID=4460 RepID=A0A843WK31_COLES|nr:hypothetical protein [Colocasia esculenta]
MLPVPGMSGASEGVFVSPSGSGVYNLIVRFRGYIAEYGRFQGFLERSFDNELIASSQYCCILWLCSGWS